MTSPMKNTEPASARMLSPNRFKPGLPIDERDLSGRSAWTWPALCQIAALVSCCAFALTVLVLCGYVALRAIESDPHLPLKDPGWHEPLDSWNL